MKITYQQRFILFGAILVSFIVIWYFGFYNIQNKRIVSIKAEIVKINSDLEKAKNSSSGIQNLKDEIARITEEIESMKKKIPSKDQLLNVSNLIKRKGEQYGLNIQRISPQKDLLFTKAPGSSSIIKVPINIWLSGKYFSLGKFLESFDSFPFLIKTGSVIISGNDDNYPNLDIELIVYSYLYNQ